MSSNLRQLYYAATRMIKRCDEDLLLMDHALTHADFAGSVGSKTHLGYCKHLREAQENLRLLVQDLLQAQFDFGTFQHDDLPSLFE